MVSKYKTTKNLMVNFKFIRKKFCLVHLLFFFLLHIPLVIVILILVKKIYFFLRF